MNFFNKVMTPRGGQQGRKANPNANLRRTSKLLPDGGMGARGDGGLQNAATSRSVAATGFGNSSRKVNASGKPPPSSSGGAAPSAQYTQHMDPASGAKYNVNTRTSSTHWDGERGGGDLLVASDPRDRDRNRDDAEVRELRRVGSVRGRALVAEAFGGSSGSGFGEADSGARPSSSGRAANARDAAREALRAADDFAFAPEPSAGQARAQVQGPGPGQGQGRPKAGLETRHSTRGTPYTPHIDPSTGAVYNVNSRTKSTHWDGERAMDAGGGAAAATPVPPPPAGGGGAQQVLDPAWQPQLDEASGATYYWNAATKQTTWDPPLISAAAAAGAAGGVGLSAAVAGLSEKRAAASAGKMKRVPSVRFAALPSSLAVNDTPPGTPKIEAMVDGGGGGGAVGVSRWATMDLGGEGGEGGEGVDRPVSWGQDIPGNQLMYGGRRRAKSVHRDQAEKLLLHLSKQIALVIKGNRSVFGKKVNDVKKLFSAIDRDGTGLISRDQFEKVRRNRTMHSLYTVPRLHIDDGVCGYCFSLIFSSSSSSLCV
jgi:hypothetical protein